MRAKDFRQDEQDPYRNTELHREDTESHREKLCREKLCEALCSSVLSVSFLTLTV
jgi:hypothetical protein